MNHDSGEQTAFKFNAFLKNMQIQLFATFLKP